jgi:hypothetical protein
MTEPSLAWIAELSPPLTPFTVAADADADAAATVRPPAVRTTQSIAIRTLASTRTSSVRTSGRRAQYS